MERSALLKVVVYSLVSGVGIAVIFGAGVSSAAALAEAVRERRRTAGLGWGTLAVVCLAAAVAAVVLGIVVMTTKG